MKNKKKIKQLCVAFVLIIIGFLLLQVSATYFDQIVGVVMGSILIIRGLTIIPLYGKEEATNGRNDTDI